MKRAEKRDHMVAVASELFNRHGYHGVGIDLVIARAGVAKTTLYRHFPSKEDLIVAVLQRFDQQFRRRMREAVDGAAGTPEAKLLATFDVLESWFAERSFFGCPFMGAAGEYGQRTSPVFQAVAMHKRLMIALFEELARAAGLTDPEQVAADINLLHEGATACAHVSGDPGQAGLARRAAARLIDQYRPPPAGKPGKRRRA